MARSLGVCFAVVAILAFASRADAWTRVSPASDDSPIVQLRTQRGSTLVAWYGAGYSTSVVLRRDAEAPRVIGSVRDGGVALAPLVLLQQPSGTVLVYFTAQSGTFRLSSIDDGRTWTGPVKTSLSADARIEGGAVLPDGTPIFTAIDDDQADPWTLALYEGIDLQRRQDSAVAEAHGVPVVTPRGGVYFVYDIDPSYASGGIYLQRLDAAGRPVGPPRRQSKELLRFELTGDLLGDLFATTYRGGRIHVINLHTKTTWSSGRVYQLDGLTVTLDQRNRLWLVWIDARTIHGVLFHRGSFRIGARIRAVDLPPDGPFGSTLWGFVAIPQPDGHLDAYVSSQGKITEQPLRQAARHPRLEHGHL